MNYSTRFNFKLPTAADTSLVIDDLVNNFNLADTALLSASGVVGLNQGGTAKALTAANGGIVYSDSDSLEILTPTATAGQILRSGSNAAPSWSTPTYPNSAGTSGFVLMSDGTNIVSQAQSNIDHDSLANFSANKHIDHSAVSIINGNGITGGGTLSANRTLALTTLTGDWDIGDGRMIQADKIRARDGDGLALYEDGGAGIFVKDGGNVGIGTAAPSAKLAINGGLHVGGDSDPGDNNLLVDGYIVSPTIYGSSAANGDITIEATTSVTKTTSFVLLQPNGGNVVIGSLASLYSDYYHLQIVKSDPAIIFAQSTTASNYSEFRFFNDAGDGLFARSYGTTNTGNHAGVARANGVALMAGATIASLYIGSTSTASIPIYFGTTGTSWVKMAAGIVGIGTTSASAKLAINGGLHVGGDSDPGDNNLLVDGTATITTDLTVNGNTTLGNASTDTITLTGRAIFRTAASDPQHATAGSRPAGSVGEMVYYTGKMYFCTNAATPTWEKITST